MKKFLRLIFNSRPSRFIRKIIDFRPTIALFPYHKQHLASDLFIWRTDDNFETLFNASDILAKYYGLKSKLFFLFFDNQGKPIRSLELRFQEGVTSFLIDKNVVNQEGYGTFCVFNIPLQKHNAPLNVTNRCYIGYGKNKEFSMVHGNLDAIMITDPYASIETISDIIQPAISDVKTKFIYHVQRKFTPNTTISFGFANPLKRKIKVEVNNKTITIMPRGCGFIEITESFDNKPHIVRSDFCLARPIIISKNKGFIDCHHG